MIEFRECSSLTFTVRSAVLMAARLATFVLPPKCRVSTPTSFISCFIRVPVPCQISLFLFATGTYCIPHKNLDIFFARFVPCRSECERKSVLQRDLLFVSHVFTLYFFLLCLYYLVCFHFIRYSDVKTFTRWICSKSFHVNIPTCVKFTEY